MHSGVEKSFAINDCLPLLFSINSHEYTPLPMRLSLPLVPVIGSNIVYPLKLSILETKMDKLSRVVLMLALENIVIAYGDFMVQIYDF